MTRLAATDWNGVDEVLRLVVTDSREVAEDLPRRDRRSDLRVVGEKGADGRVEVEPALIDEPRRDRSGDQLRDAGQPEALGRRGRDRELEVGETEARRPGDLAIPADGDGEARNAGLLAQRRRDLRRFGGRRTLADSLSDRGG